MAGLPIAGAELYTGQMKSGVDMKMFPRLRIANYELFDRGQSSIGAIICAKRFLARFNRDLTVPKVTPVISEISSYALPSNSRRTNTTRWCSGSSSTANSTFSRRYRLRKSSSGEYVLSSNSRGRWSASQFFLIDWNRIRGLRERFLSSFFAKLLAIV